MDTLGIVESRSIAAGAALADRMVKAAQVELARAATVCSGRFLIFVTGGREEVENAVREAGESGAALSGAVVISRISPQVTQALKKTFPAGPGDSLAVVECKNVSSGIHAADAAVKRSAVRLARLVTGQGIRGKSYFVLCGDVASVTEAAEAARSVLGLNLVEAVVLPRPDVRVLKALTSVMR